jgi:hypothetical protein
MPFGDDVADIDTDTEPDAPFVADALVAIRHAALNLDGAPHGLKDAREFGQQAVARILYGTSLVLPDLRIDELPKMRFEPLMRSFLVEPMVTRGLEFPTDINPNFLVGHIASRYGPGLGNVALSQQLCHEPPFRVAGSG